MPRSTYTRLSAGWLTWSSMRAEMFRFFGCFTWGDDPVQETANNLCWALKNTYALWFDIV